MGGRVTLTGTVLFGRIEAETGRPVILGLGIPAMRGQETEMKTTSRNSAEYTAQKIVGRWQDDKVMQRRRLAGGRARG